MSVKFYANDYGWKCPHCGGTTIASSTYTDYCADCGEVFEVY